MCGIIGGFDRARNPFGVQLAHAACDRMRHRGPDDQGWFEADGILVGNRRLSVLDLSGGGQPMFSDDGQIVVVQNGEIYNYVELSKGLACRTTCDTEVILRLYERDGEDFVSRLNGMFAIAILDRRRRRLLLYRDRVGKKPLYLHDDGKRLLFASEIKSLHAMGVKPEVDPTAIDAFLTYNYVPPPLTMFRGVEHLMPGEMLTIDDAGTRRRAWWRLADVAQETRSTTAWQEELLDTLRDATRIRLRSDVPLGAFLSGGIDSSTVVRLMSQCLDRPVKTFSIGFDDPRFDESAHAEQVAKLCGTDHCVEFMSADWLASWPLSIYHNDQPHGDVSFVPTYWVSRLARKHVTVVLTGDGGDELFAGYDVHRRLLTPENLALSDDAFEQAYLNGISLFTHDEKAGLYTSEACDSLGGFEAFDLATRHLRELKHFDRVNQALGLDVKMLLPGNNLVKPDRMAMAVSLEPRAPMLDARVVELAFRMPGSLKLVDGRTKAILKSAVEHILPREIIHRPKQMFTVPIGEWFKDHLRGFVIETLLARRTVERGLFEPRVLSAMIDAHSSGTANYTRQLRALVALELWHRMFIDAEFTAAPTYEDLGLTGVPSLKMAA